MEQKNYLAFSVGHEYFAISTNHIKEVLIHHYYTRLPDEDTQVSGIINYKGKKLPVINTQKRLNVSPKRKQANNAIIIFEVDLFQEKYSIAASVSSVDDVIKISDEEICNLDSSKSKCANDSYIMGLAQYHYQDIQVIKAENFLNIPSLESVEFQYQNVNCIA